MRCSLRSTIVALGCVAALAGCNSFLDGDKLGVDPNNPGQASNNALFAGATIRVSVQLQSRLARSVCVFMQQCAGQSQYLSLGNYSTSEDDFYPNWSNFYGALLDVRTIKTRTRATGDSLYYGIATVMESFIAGNLADLWGDVPFTDAAGPSVAPTPTPVPQQQVYTAIQAGLDTAIAFMAATSSRNVGPTFNDIVYGGDRDKWIALAHTLKARYYLHTAKRLGSVAYTAARAEALLGIQPGNDYAVALSGQGATQSDLWGVFQSIFPGFIVAGEYLVDYMNATADPRLPGYFALDGNGAYAGAPPGIAVSPNDVSNIADARLAGNFPRAYVTWAENQLILAEASYQLGQGPAARTALQAVWTAAGVTRTVPPAATAGPTDSLFLAIMNEKYVSQFQNIETWQDWQRTGVPALVPAPGGTIPRRLVYPLSERNANPNIPGPGPARNWNDPAS